jgi:hypothetical protein
LFPLTITSLARAATYVVNSSADPGVGTASNCLAGNSNTCTLRDAVAAVAGGDTITFESTVTNIQLTSASALNVTDASGNAVTIDGGGTVTVDGIHATRVFTIGTNATAVITGLTIQNGQVAAGQGGGAIYSSGALTVKNSTLSGNTAYEGGAIFNNQGTLTITNSSVSGNTSDEGGGIYVAGGQFRTLTIADSTISGNYSYGAGGGILAAGEFTTYLTISGSTVSGNTSRYNGGGIECGCQGTITNSTIANNASKLTNGGGIFNFGMLVLVNTTLSGNTDHHGSNGTVSAGGASIEFRNTIVNDACGGAGLMIDDRGNLDVGTSCGFSDASSKSTAKIGLGVLENNGGPTKTMLPGAGSDAINFVTCANAPLVDQRNFLRPVPSSVGLAKPCDSGATEVGSISSDRLFANGFGPPPIFK